jgi:hypothetical protein
MNKVGARGSWRLFKYHKDLWQNMLGMEMLVMVTPKRKLLTPVVADALICFPVRRRRDEGNFRMLLEKSLGDALVAGDWIPDDEPDFYRFRSVTFGSSRQPTTVIELTEGEIAWTSRTHAQ